MKLLLLLFLTLASAARAAQPALDPPPNAALPLDLHWLSEWGKDETIRQALDGKPAALVFADWTCRAVCGTALGLAAAALEQTGLRPGTDFSLIAIGINPRDGPADAAAMKSAYLAGSPVIASAHFLSGNAAVITAATNAMGYRAVFLPDQDQYAHPAAILAVGPDGTLRRVLPVFGLSADALRDALTDARPASIGTRLLTLCNAAFLSARNGWILPALMGAGVATLLGMAGGFAVLRRREARR